MMMMMMNWEANCSPTNYFKIQYLFVYFIHKHCKYVHFPWEHDVYIYIYTYHQDEEMMMMMIPLKVRLREKKINVYKTRNFLLLDFSTRYRTYGRCNKKNNKKSCFRYLTYLRLRFTTTTTLLLLVVIVILSPTKLILISVRIHVENYLKFCLIPCFREL